MNPPDFTSLAEAAVPILMGLYGTLLGYRVVGKPPGLYPEYDRRHERWGKWLKVLGPLVILLGILQYSLKVPLFH